MKARLFVTLKDGEYIFRAEGDKITVSRLKMEYSGSDGDYDIFHKAGNPARKIAIHFNQLSWLGDGKEREIFDFKFIEVSK